LQTFPIKNTYNNKPKSSFSKFYNNFVISYLNKPFFYTKKSSYKLFKKPIQRPLFHKKVNFSQLYNNNLKQTSWNQSFNKPWNNQNNKPWNQNYNNFSNQNYNNFSNQNPYNNNEKIYKTHKPWITNKKYNQNKNRNKPWNQNWRQNNQNSKSG
jgi:hypothetical protein